MKKTIKLKIIIILFSVFLLASTAFAAITASTYKTTKLPWQGTPNGHCDSEHNVGASSTAQSRFSFTGGTSGAGGSSIVYDSVTKLTWQSNGTVAGNITWGSAKTYCTNLNLGGTGWRLPNIKELQSIVDYSKYNPSIDTAFFTSGNDYYWSSTTYANPTDYAWIVNFSDGNSTYYFKTHNYYVRCVR